MVRTRTRGARLADVSRRVASMPSMPGIRMSIRTTSGLLLLAGPDGLGAVGGGAEHGEVRLRVEQAANPARTTSWSSATTIPMVTRASGSARWQVASTQNPPPAAAPVRSDPPTARARSRMPSRPCPPPPCDGAA